MAGEISTRHVQKFDGKNFQAWKFQIKQIFVSQDLLSIVTGDKPKPNDDALAATWTKENAKAMFVMSSAMEYDQLETLLTCTTAKDMWDNLIATHEQKSATLKLLLRQRFHEYRMDTNDTVAKHIAKVQNLAKQLLDVGENIPEAIIISKILTSLPSKYRVFRSSWGSVAPDRQTFEYLRERLIEEEAYMSSETEEAAALAVTMMGKRHVNSNSSEKSNKKPATRDKKLVRCFYCKQTGHVIKNCPKKIKKQNPGNDQNHKDTKNFALTVSSSEKSGKNIIQQDSKTRIDDDVIKCILDAPPSDIWLIDSGASAHISYRREWFTDYQPKNDGSTVSLGDGRECKVVGIGTVLVKQFVYGQWYDSCIKNVLHVPEMQKNLLSVGMCDENGLKLVFTEGRVEFFRGSDLIATGVKQSNNIYRMMCLAREIPKLSEQAYVSASSLKTWHERLGHLNTRALKALTKNESVIGVKLNNSDDVFCDDCHLDKAHRLPFSDSRNPREVKPGEFIHTDVCGPMSEDSLGGARYYVNFKDDASGFRCVYFIKHKSDVFDKFKIFERFIANKFGQVMKKLRSDRGGEYVNEQMLQYMRTLGIEHEPTAPYTPEQNGRAERDNRTIIECARTMLNAKSLPRFLWAEAVNAAIYLIE